jgi:hypothetical protein
MPMPKEHHIEAISGVNPRGEGFVHIRVSEPGVRDQVVQCTPAKAREIAQFIFEAAEAADTDSFLFQFMRNKVGLDPEGAAQVLVDFRAWREISGGVKSRMADDPHWKDMHERIEEDKA